MTRIFLTDFKWKGRGGGSTVLPKWCIHDNLFSLIFSQIFFVADMIISAYMCTFFSIKNTNK